LQHFLQYRKLSRDARNAGRMLCRPEAEELKRCNPERNVTNILKFQSYSVLTTGAQ